MVTIVHLTEGSPTDGNLTNSTNDNLASGVGGDQGVLTTKVHVATNQRIERARDDVQIAMLLAYYSWCVGFCSSQVSSSTRTYVVVEYLRVAERVTDRWWPGGETMLALYSVGGNRCYGLPGFQGDELYIGGSWGHCEYATLDKKIYCFGHNNSREFCHVQVLDLARQHRKWEPCQQMQFIRSHYACGVVDGKIYACGGQMGAQRFNGTCEVYDPELNTWSSIANMTSARHLHHIVTFGGELYAYGGWSRATEEEVEFGGLLEDEAYKALDLEIYNPAMNEWRVLEDWGLATRQRLFVQQGKLHAMTSTTISVLEGSVEDNRWRELHVFSLPCNYDDVERHPILAVGSELVTVRYFRKPGGEDDGEDELCLLRSEGFGSTTRELVWKEANCRYSFLFPSFLGMVQV